ncbi:hypothetical protein, partial [Gemmiger formicilis]|uniref:hypothetical protein n=1 Tax=Gemmiger formicilis TaxID=745368 RepID=UPI00195C9D23
QQAGKLCPVQGRRRSGPPQSYISDRMKKAPMVLAIGTFVFVFPLFLPQGKRKGPLEAAR